MSSRSFVALPLVALSAMALLGAHCRSSEQSPSPSAPLGGGKPSGAAADLPNSGLTEAEASRLLPGVDTAALSPAQRQSLVEIASDTFCPCAGTTVAGCLRAETVCRPAVRLTQLAANMLSAGQPQAHVLMRVEAYYASFAKDRRRDVSTDGPIKGDPDARVTVVEFSDYQCPSCKAVHPVLDELVKKYPNDVRVVFRHFPLPQHPKAAEAAAAAVWAAEQGRFWPFTDLVFQNQSRLDEIGVEAVVAQAGLDPKKLEAALSSSDKYEKKVALDRAEGEALQIGGTPSLFINGRQLLLPPSAEYLSWTIEDELEWLANGESWTSR